MAAPPPRYTWREFFNDYVLLLGVGGGVSSMIVFALYLYEVLPSIISLPLGAFLAAVAFVALVGRLAFGGQQSIEGLGISQILVGLPAKQRTLALPEKLPLPEITVKISEVFIQPFHGGSLCFVNCSLHNPTGVICDVPREGYSLSLTLEGHVTPFETTKTLEVFGNYYVGIFKEIIDEYDGESEYIEIDRDNVMLPPRGILKRGKPVFGWLGFEFRGLPIWPSHKNFIGTHEEFDYDENGTIINIQYVDDVETVLTIKNVELVTLTVVDPFGQEHHGWKEPPFHENNRSVVKEKKIH